MFHLALVLAAAIPRCAWGIRDVRTPRSRGHTSGVHVGFHTNHHYHHYLAVKSEGITNNDHQEMHVCVYVQPLAIQSAELFFSLLSSYAKYQLLSSVHHNSRHIARHRNDLITITRTITMIPLIILSLSYSYIYMYI